ncbi:MAG: Gfo/Idh/MocA family oxidoreductase [Planctomycetia bacterium]|nr:Gfo/Idh/MocA family oxidoreductase [Planctomycetia bacterium]
MSTSASRRAFLRQSALMAGTLATSAVSPAARAADSPQEAVVLGVIGTNGRGAALAGSFAALGGARIAYVCDVDERVIDKAVSAVAVKQDQAPKRVGDLRRIFDDATVDAVVIATPDHWHAPATILACAAGKHVYVEKPASHNPREGELMIAAARKHARVVQLGTQRRSMPGHIEAIERLRAGEIGRVLFSRGWYTVTRGSIGHGKPTSVPPGLDYALWQGPAPEREYRDNVVHYNWHWFWNWGTGELGNNGIHSLDICRWGLGVDYPRRVSAGGGKYFFDDDQETPDTHVVTYDFGDKAITWEGRNWHRHGFEGSTFGIAFYGDRGSMVLDFSGYKILDAGDKQIASQTNGFEGHDPHLKNFLECVRSGARPNADIEEGHKSTLLCHLGNIAYRTGHTLDLDPRSGQIQNDPAASALWSREYRPNWEPKV